MRILVTGSRDWTDSYTVRGALLGVAAGVKDVTLISGGCPDGADAIAELVARRQGWAIETHVADWDGLGKRAGFIRNKAMVESEPDVCIAFVKNQSRGASMTVDLAKEAGIPIELYTLDHYYIEARTD
jgi:hypothetical protein